MLNYLFLMTLYVCLFRIIEEYKAAPHIGIKRNAIHYSRAKTYDVVDVGGVKELILKSKSTNEKPVIVPAYTRYFEILSKIHKNTGHAGKYQTCLELENSYSIPRWAVSLFVEKCLFCQQKRGTIVKPIINIHFNSRGQVAFIDLQSVPDGEYRWIMYYQDYFTRYSFLRPLRNKNVVEVAVELFHIFTDFGYPKIFQSDKDDEFTASVLVELLKMWPDCHIIHGRPRDTSLQGSVRSAIGDVKNCLRAWMSDNNTTSWSTGLRIVQWRRNAMLHSTIKKSPYAALFGKEPNWNIWHETLPKQDEDQISSNSGKKHLRCSI